MLSEFEFSTYISTSKLWRPWIVNLYQRTFNIHCCCHANDLLLCTPQSRQSRTNPLYHFYVNVNIYMYLAYPVGYVSCQNIFVLHRRDIRCNEECGMFVGQWNRPTVKWRRGWINLLWHFGIIYSSYEWRRGWLRCYLNIRDISQRYQCFIKLLLLHIYLTHWICQEYPGIAVDAIETIFMSI
jgi:hypothetical protein